MLVYVCTYSVAYMCMARVYLLCTAAGAPHHKDFFHPLKTLARMDTDSGTGMSRNKSSCFALNQVAAPDPA